VDSVKKEVILSASILNSPKILMLSGVGDADYLESMGIDVNIDSPQVGLNLRDKLTLNPPMEYVIPNPALTHEGPVPGIFYNDGIDPSDSRSSNMATYCIPFKIPAGLVLILESEVTYTTCDGSVRLLDIDPFSEVKFSLNCYQPNPNGGPSIDLLHQLKMFKDYRRLMANFQAYFGEPVIEISPGLNVVPPDATDAEIIQYLLSVGSIAFQPGGTCRAGTSIENSVVDEHMMVWGSSNLRVVDISAIPNVMQGPPTGGALAISERISDEIKEIWS